DEEIQNKPVSWEASSESWEETIKEIGKQNKLVVVINPVEKTIGITGQEKKQLAVHLANRVPEIWELTPGKTLKSNLDAWATKAGWQLHWHDDLKVDYMIEHKAVMTGKFLGDEGVITQVLNSLGGANVPLRAEFYTKNKVLLITEAGFEQEVKY
ncbi:toxin co-regulated pilus biosynthesis Q family protein, partial [Vibrio splendidus]